MQKYVQLRLLQAAVTLLILSVAVFLSIRLTGDPALYLLGPDSGQEHYLRLQRALGLDKPLLEQYWLFLSNIVRGDLGRSFISGQPVSELILARLPATLQLAAAAFAVEIFLGVSVGILSAVRRGSWLDRMGKFFSLLGIATPNFWIAIMLILLFGVLLGWLPTFGRQEGLRSLILPAFVIGWAGAAGMTRLVRSSMLEVLDTEYVKFARIKGLPERIVIYKHALRNALIPPLTFAGLSLAGLLNGTVVAEVVFGWPGVGRLMLESVRQRDFNVLQATILVTALVYIVIALIVDILYAYVNPKIRYQGP
jgi:peptide/nickel transport system permease protein